MNIIVIENEKRIATGIKETLEKDSHSVSVVSSGDAGLKQINSGEYNLLIINANLTNIDGLDVVKELREADIHIPVLMLNSRGTTEEIVTSLDNGADDCLVIPFAFEELLARVRALLRRSKMDRGAFIYFADLKIDPITRRVWRSGTEIVMRNREYSILEYLALNPNKVVPRYTLAKQVWGPTFDSFSNVIDVYLSFLRRQIDKSFTTKLIHTVRKQGYILREG